MMPRSGPAGGPKEKRVEEKFRASFRGLGHVSLAEALLKGLATSQQRRLHLRLVDAAAAESCYDAATGADRQRPGQMLHLNAEAPFACTPCLTLAILENEEETKREDRLGRRLLTGLGQEIGRGQHWVGRDECRKGVVCALQEQGFCAQNAVGGHQFQLAVR